jgi:hypothetical protein
MTSRVAVAAIRAEVLPFWAAPYWVRPLHRDGAGAELGLKLGSG